MRMTMKMSLTQEERVQTGVVQRMMTRRTTIPVQPPSLWGRWFLVLPTLAAFL